MSTETTAATGDTTPVTPETSAPPTGAPSSPDPAASAERTRQEQTEAPVDDGGDGGDGGDKPKSRSQRRIEQLLARNRDLERQLHHYGSTAPARKPASLDPLDYPNEAAYNRAVIQDTVQATQREFARQQAEAASREAGEVTQEVWTTRWQDMAERVPDFEAVAFSASIPYSPTMTRIIRQIEAGPQIAYYLGKNSAEAQRISQLSPLDAVLEIGALSERIKGPAARSVSKAPPPVKTVQGGSSATGFRPDTDDVDAYFAARKKA